MSLVYFVKSMSLVYFVFGFFLIFLVILYMRYQKRKNLVIHKDMPEILDWERGDHIDVDVMTSLFEKIGKSECYFVSVYDEHHVVLFPSYVSSPYSFERKVQKESSISPIKVHIQHLTTDKVQNRSHNKRSSGDLLNPDTYYKEWVESYKEAKDELVSKSIKN